MICPNCGEPVMTRHLFCAVCGADLKDVKPEKIHERLKSALKPSSHHNAESNFAQGEADSGALSDYMHNFT